VLYQRSTFTVDSEIIDHAALGASFFQNPHLICMFAKVDRNNDGYVTFLELLKFMCALYSTNHLIASINSEYMHPHTPTARLEKINLQYFPNKPLPEIPKRVLDPRIVDDIEALFTLCARAAG
jgi:hypothetical protein